jgi:4-hydroxybenzoyl-CoA thioesterase
MKTLEQHFAIEWAHCDAAGFVFYPYFYTWFDQATERLFKANGLGYPDLERELGVTGMPLVETGTSYLAPCRLGNQVLMQTWVDEWKGRTFLVKHVISLENGDVGLEGFERRVMVQPDRDSPKGIKAVRIPEAAMKRFVD